MQCRAVLPTSATAAVLYYQTNQNSTISEGDCKVFKDSGSKPDSTIVPSLFDL